MSEIRKTTHAPLVAAALAAFFAGASAASAVTVQTTFVNANVNVNGETDGSGSLPVATATATSTVSTQGATDVHTGTAVQNENGFSSLELTVNCDGNEGFACTGGTDVIENRATAIREVSFTNDTGVAQTGTFSFSLSNMKLETWHYGGSDPEASIEFAVGATNGANYFAEMTLLSTFPPSGPLHEIITSTNFSGTVQNSECSFGFCHKGTVDVNPLSGSISLGTLAPGQSVAVQTTFDIFTKYTPTEVGAQASAQDPGSYSWSFTPAGNPSVVPLPASGWALLSAFGLVAALRRRRARV